MLAIVSLILTAPLVALTGQPLTIQQTRQRLEAHRKQVGAIKEMGEALLVREWGGDAFHRRVLELESRGYIARRETYRITAEMNPETGEIIHLHTIEMFAGSGGVAPPSARE